VKNNTRRKIIFTICEVLSARKDFLLVLLLLLGDLACAQKYLVAPTDGKKKIEYQDEFLSASYCHFEGGVFFSDIEFGLDVLWRASFKGKNPYKENLGLFVPDGLLILPNIENMYNRSRISALPTQLKEGKLFVLYKTTLLEVLGIIHTHPDPYSIPMPAPKNDYQYCYLGIHNYVMDQNNLFDAYKDSWGRECYRRLGHRSDYHRIPFVSPIYLRGEKSTNKL
jgi:hypothetical protein